MFRPWRVSVVDGLFGRYEGCGIVLASSEDEARKVVAEYLRFRTAYGKPFEVSNVEPHDHPSPHVVFFNWGEMGHWPQEHEDEGLDDDWIDQESVGPLRFTAPDGQIFWGQRRGSSFWFWLDGQEDQHEALWDAWDRSFALETLAATLGFHVGQDEFPVWMDALESVVVNALWPDADADDDVDGPDAAPSPGDANPSNVSE